LALDQLGDHGWGYTVAAARAFHGTKGLVLAGR